MRSIDRWLNWRPPSEKFGEIPGSEPTKPTEPPEPTFVGFVSSIRKQNQNFLHPDAWREAFRMWRRSGDDNRRDGYGNLVSSYYIDFCAWVAGDGMQHSKVCRRKTFERLLLEEIGLITTEGELTGYGTSNKKTSTTRKSRSKADR